MEELVELIGNLFEFSTFKSLVIFELSEDNTIFWHLISQRKFISVSETPL